MFVALHLCVCKGPSDRAQYSTRLCLEIHWCNKINTLFTGGHCKQKRLERT